MATFTLHSKGLSVNLTTREKRVLRRSSIDIDKKGLLIANSAAFPGNLEMGVRISKRLFLGGVLGEFRTSSKRTVVLGSQKSEGQCLRIRVSHPNIDEIWVCGKDSGSLETKLTKYMKLANGFFPRRVIEPKDI